MTGIDPRAFEFALSKIEDGFVFERFAIDFVGKVLGYEFIPVGGVKDRGIDGLEHTFCRKGFERHVYQMTIDKRYEAKIEDTIEKLSANKIDFDSLALVTNRVITSKDVLIDTLFDKHKKPIRVFDLKWLSSYANQSSGTVNAYHTFVDSYLHEFNHPGKTYYVGDLVKDPRLFVFLRQQWEANRGVLKLDVLLADTLILYALEGTDPDKEIFKTKEEVKKEIASYIKYNPKLLYNLIDKRLATLTKKPRQVHFHKRAKAYCLPFRTRLQIQEKNLKDAALYEEFEKGVEAKLKAHLGVALVAVRDCVSLIEATINRLFYQQGLEFADFVLHGETKTAFEKDLPEIISSIVENSTVVAKNKDAVKSALLTTIRDVVYNGTPEQKLYLKRLSNTYMMLFLLHCDPKIATYFSAMASKLRVYVCTSIIIPALSEFYLDSHNRRHWNLLVGARNAGVTMLVNERIVRELVAHFRRIIHIYHEVYEDNEDFYLSDEAQTLYIDEILIRAYFYAKRGGRVHTFYDFVDNFVNPDLLNAEASLISWLKDEFGIEYRTDQSIGVRIDNTEKERLAEALAKVKKNVQKARSDASVILSIFAQREQRNEIASDSIFGYRTWWLSKDTLTQRTVNKVFKDKYKVSCYIRPDFLYNYISLAPTKGEVDSAYKELFPSLLGVNISSHLPKEVTDFVHQKISEHADKNPTRLKAILRDMAEKLKVDPTMQSRERVEHYLDAELKGIEGK